MPLERRDTSGNNIEKGQKFKLTFRDKVQTGQSVADVNFVESYKKYNAMDDTEESTTICKCSIF